MPQVVYGLSINDLIIDQLEKSPSAHRPMKPNANLSVSKMSYRHKEELNKIGKTRLQDAPRGQQAPGRMPPGYNHMERADMNKVEAVFTELYAYIFE